MNESKPLTIEEAAALTATMWTEGAGIYFGELRRLTGLTLEQAMLFDMLCTWRDIQTQNAAPKYQCDDRSGVGVPRGR